MCAHTLTLPSTNTLMSLMPLDVATVYINRCCMLCLQSRIWLSSASGWTWRLFWMATLPPTMWWRLWDISHTTVSERCVQLPQIWQYDKQKWESNFICVALFSSITAIFPLHCVLDAQQYSHYTVCTGCPAVM